MKKDPLSGRLLFGDKKQIEALKAQNEKAQFCPDCNALAKEWYDFAAEDSGEYFECENCKTMWWEENGKTKYERF